MIILLVSLPRPGTCPPSLSLSLLPSPVSQLVLCHLPCEPVPQPHETGVQQSLLPGHGGTQKTLDVDRAVVTPRLKLDPVTHGPFIPQNRKLKKSEKARYKQEIEEKNNPAIN